MIANNIISQIILLA